MPLEARLDSKVPVPCRHCGEGVRLFAITEGTHSLKCPKCGKTTYVNVLLKGEDVEIRTSLQKTDSSNNTVERQVRDETPAENLKEILMPKRKLTEEQRQKIREQIRKQLDAGVLKSKILASISQEYAITTEAARWYFNSAGDRSSGQKSTLAHRRQKTHRRPTKVRGRKPTDRTQNRSTSAHSPPGSKYQFVKVVQRLEERTLQAKKLVTQWEGSQARIRKLQEKLRREKTKADEFEREIVRLRG